MLSTRTYQCIFSQPKRPLSAYNIFFKEERHRILESIPESAAAVEEEDSKQPGRKRRKNPHGKIGFENLAKIIGQRWQELGQPQVQSYKVKAEADKLRYKEEMEAYTAKQQLEEQSEDQGGVDDEDIGGDDSGNNDGPSDSSNQVPRKRKARKNTERTL